MTSLSFNNRLSALDNLRACLALLGFPLHAVLFLGGGLYAHPLVPDENMAQFARSLPILAKGYFLSIYYVHTFRMPVFFLLAGFFAHSFCQRRGETMFIMDRLYKIGLPFLFCQIWALPFYIIFFTTHYFFPYIYTDVVQNLITKYYNMSGGSWGRMNSLNFDWFLYFLLWFYAVTFFFLQLKGRWRSFSLLWMAVDRFILILFSSRWRHISIGLCCSVLLSRAVNVGFMPHSIKLVSSLNEIGAFAVWYGVGWWLWGHQDKFSVFFNRSGLKFLLSIVLYGAFLYEYLHHTSNDNIYSRNISVFLYQLSVSFSVLVLFGVAWRFASKPNRIFRYISGASYWLYLVQVPIVVTLILVMLCLDFDYMQHENFIILSLEVSGISLFIALISYHLFVRYTVFRGIFRGKIH